MHQTSKPQHCHETKPAARGENPPAERDDKNAVAFWRSLDQKNGPAEPQRLGSEFSPATLQPRTALTRREALKLMASSAALAGLTGCTKLPTEHIVPYVRQPEEVVTGEPLFYATAMTLG